MKAPAAHLELPGGPSAYVFAADAYRFDGYARYAALDFDEREKARVRAECIPGNARRRGPWAQSRAAEADGAS